MSTIKKISFAIPVYKNEQNIQYTYKELKKLFVKELKDYAYEFWFVNDGSPDDSLSELLKIRKVDTNVKIISFSRNFGAEKAISAGMNACTGDVVISISADLQDPVELIPVIISKISSGDDVVICHREEREDYNVTSSLYYYFMKKVGVDLPAGGFDYWGISKKANQQLSRIDERHRALQVDLLWLGFKRSFLPYKRQNRAVGKSAFTFKKRFNGFIVTFMNSTYIPIRIMSIVGILVATIGFVYSLSIVYNYFINNVPFKGWAPIMITILIIGGLIMLMLGIIGEYLWRIYDESKKRPYYIIDQVYD